MKEEKFTLGDEKQMVQRVRWNGGLTAPAPGKKTWGRGQEMLLRNLDKLSTIPEKDSPSHEDSRQIISLKIFTFKRDFLEIW